MSLVFCTFRDILVSHKAVRAENDESFGFMSYDKIVKQQACMLLLLFLFYSSPGHICTEHSIYIYV